MYSSSFSTTCYLYLFMQEIALLKERKVDQEKLEEIKVMEYLKQKAVRETAPFTNMVSLRKYL